MVLSQSVDPSAVKFHRTVRSLIFRDHLLAAAGIPGEAEALYPYLRRKNPRLDQRLCQYDEAAGMASGIGDPAGGNDGLSLPFQLRKTVGPTLFGAVGG